MGNRKTIGWKLINEDYMANFEASVGKIIVGAVE